MGLALVLTCFYVSRLVLVRMPVSACTKIDLPKIADARGNLTFVEGVTHVPFNIQRVYYLYDVPRGSERGAHAHRGLHQFMICMSGSFDLILDDGREKKSFNMNRPYYGVYICPMIWRRLENFSSGSVCVVLASEKYEESDYIRDYDQFLLETGNL